MDYSKEKWEKYYTDNETLIPYLNACGFAVKRLKKYPEACIFELGCGNGQNLKYLKGLFPSIQCFGCDVSEHAIKMARRDLPDAQLWVNTDDLSLPENHFDLVIERACLQHVSKPLARSYVDQIYHSMRKGSEGYFEIASEYHGLNSNKGESRELKSVGLMVFYSETELRELFKKFEIHKIYHLKRELIYYQKDDNDPSNYSQGSFQIEIVKK